MKISIVIPCYNESQNIPKIRETLLPVLADLPADALELVLVNDGSTDSTLRDLLAFQSEHAGGRLAISVASHPTNKGLGAALRTGFAISSGEIVVTTDSDGTYAFDTIPQLLQRLTAAVHIVTASPYHPHGGVDGVPPYRLLLSKGSSFIYRILVDWRVHTYTSLFRAYRRGVIERIPFASDGFLAGTELMVKAMLSGFRVAEFPAVLHRRVYGVSKAKIARTIAAHLRFQRQVLLHRLHVTSLVPRGKTNRGNVWQHDKM